jgi:hypothetical protein
MSRSVIQEDSLTIVNPKSLIIAKDSRLSAWVGEGDSQAVRRQWGDVVTCAEDLYRKMDHTECSELIWLSHSRMFKVLVS